MGQFQNIFVKIDLFPYSDSPSFAVVARSANLGLVHLFYILCELILI